MTITDSRSTVRELFTHRPEPILTAAGWPVPVGAVFNPGAAVHDGQTVLLCRVEDRRGISHLAVARSTDGETGWQIEPRPLIAPGDDPHSCYGVEDPRITWVRELGGYVIAYVCHGIGGTAIALAITDDFQTIEPVGRALPLGDGNACLLPELVDGRFALLHRPVSHRVHRADIWLSRSPDLRSWTGPRLVLSARSGTWWDSARVGMGPAPIRTPDGWLGIYHGVKEQAGVAVWRAGLVLLDGDDPARVLRRSDDWVLAPTTHYERCGDTPNRVFPTGLVHEPSTDELRLYYGAADTCVGLATARLDDVLEYLAACPAVETPVTDRPDQRM